MWKRIRKIVPLLYGIYLLALRFVLEPLSDTNWLIYILVHDLRLFQIPFCLLIALICIKNRGLLLTWIALALMTVGLIGHPAWGSRPASTPTKSLKILTYNVANFGVDKSGVMKVIKESNADIICLQEACAIGYVGQAGRALSKELKGYYWTGASTNMILSRYPLKAERPLNVPTKWPTKEFPVAVVDSPLGKVRVMCVHMEPDWNAGWPPELHNLTGVLSKVCVDRQAQIDLILASLRPAKEPTLLVGDFNGPAGSEAIVRIGEFFTDSYATTEKGLGNTILAKLPFKRIDYVWCRGLVPVQTDVLDSLASDHRAVLTVVSR
jgi:endonuclease/exonuclease/phosphatase (EEP) superfamily protein YafD